MSLSGSVEDLPLLEILQVVSFCQKTGHLMVKADAGEAAVVFDSGRVVAGYAAPQDACHELVRLALEQGGKDNVTVVLAAFSATTVGTGDSPESQAATRVEPF